MLIGLNSMAIEKNSMPISFQTYAYKIKSYRDKFSQACVKGFHPSLNTCYPSFKVIHSTIKGWNPNI